MEPLPGPSDKNSCAPAHHRLAAAGLGQCSLDHLFTVDSFPSPDSKTQFLDCTIQGGGPVATALVVLARWGVTAQFAGVVCSDRFGSRILDGLRRENIETSATAVREEGRSQLAFICVERHTGRRTIFWGAPGGETLHPRELPENFLQGLGVLHLDGSFREAALSLARQARRQGVPVVLDAGSMKPGIRDLIGFTDHLIASETFARQMTQDGPLEHLLQRLKDMGPELVTVTLGERGSVSLWGKKPAFLPALPVRVVDTTGAGDVFHGAYLYGLLHGWPPEERLRWSTVTAALSCLALGGRSGIPAPDQVSAHLSALSPFQEEIPETVLRHNP